MVDFRKDFIAGEDLEDIFSFLDAVFLEDEKEFIEDIESMVSEVANYEDNSLNFKCFYCSKLCKSKRGLSRHVNVKHAALKEGSYVSTVDNPLSEEIHSKLKDILEACAEKISGDLCFPEDFRSNFCKENFSISDEDTDNLWQNIKPVVEEFNGDAEKFYSKFYGSFIENLLPSKFTEAFLTNTLLAQVANHVLFHLSGTNKSTLNDEREGVPLKDVEYKSLQYLAGFVIRKLYSSFRYNKKRNNLFHDQCSGVLQACKVEEDESQTLVNRGGLWKVNINMQQIFIHCEKIFRSATANFTTKIDCPTLVNKILKDSFILAHFKIICGNADQVVEKEVAKNLLEHIGTLFIRVRSFSYAKWRENHKASKSKVKSRSLRTSIKISSTSTAMRH